MPDAPTLAALFAPGALLFAFLFSDGSWVVGLVVLLLLESFGLAAVCLRQLFGAPKLAAALAVVAALALIGAIFVRALIASGSADDPHDE